MKYERTADGYKEYLKSAHWRMLRMTVWKRDRGTCVLCKKQGSDVHHKFYRDDWETAEPGDCITICRPCHEKQHPDKCPQNPATAPNQTSSPSKPVDPKDLFRLREYVVPVHKMLRKQKRSKHKNKHKNARRKRTSFLRCQKRHGKHWIQRGNSSN